MKTERPESSSLNKSVPDLSDGAESGTRPDSATANQALTRSIREQGLLLRGNSEQALSFPNAELAQTFEPLRVVFAIGALLLGLITSLHF